MGPTSNPNNSQFGKRVKGAIERKSNLGDMENADATSQSDPQIDYKTPKKTHSLIDSEQLLDKINILTTKPENHSQNAKVKGRTRDRFTVTG